jgi:hypothetical protein
MPAVEVSGSRAGALSAAVLAALGGGLLWAGAVIVTRYDIGILAAVVGAATGYAIHRLGGSTVTVADHVRLYDDGNGRAGRARPLDPAGGGSL